MYYANKAELLLKLRDRLPQYLACRNINVASGYFTCLNPNHNDARCSMYYDAQKKEVHCCSCGVSYDLIELICVDYRLENTEQAIAKACELFHIIYDNKLELWRDDEKSETSGYIADGPQTRLSKDNIESNYSGRLSTYFDQCISCINNTDYLSRYGIGKDQCALYNLGFDAEFALKNGQTCSAIIIPVAPDAFVAIDIDSSGGIGRYPVGGNHTFGDVVTGTSVLFIVQNEIDTLILLANGYSAYTAADISVLGELEAYIKKIEPDNVYLLNSSEGTDQELTKNLCARLSDASITASIIDLAFPYGSIREFVQRGGEKFRRRLIELSEILKPHTKQLQLNRNTAKNLACEQFTELELDSGVYGVIAPAYIRRKVLAHWLLATENRFIYCSSFGDWQIFGMVMSDRIQMYGSGYSSRLSKISLYELGRDASKDATEILSCLLSQRIKMQKSCCLILNVSGLTSNYVSELMRSLCGGLRPYNAVVIVFDSGLKERSLDEFCCTTVHLMPSDSQDEDNPYESDAIKMKAIGMDGDSTENYISAEDLG